MSLFFSLALLAVVLLVIGMVILALIMHHRNKHVHKRPMTPEEQRAWDLMMLSIISSLGGG